MKTREKIEIGVTAVLVTGFLAFLFIYNSRRKNGGGGGGSIFNNKWDKFWEKAIYGVVAHEGGKSEFGGKGKNYTDLIDLDGGTVGICHFASGGLCSLYKNMDTQSVFGRSQSEMCSRWSSKSSGAYDQSWWRNGFSSWLNNPNNNKIQIDTCLQSRQGAVDEAIKNGWTTDRQLAIAVGVSNSFGNSGFKSKARARGWDAERILDEYVYKFSNDYSSHKNRRKQLINKWFPVNKTRRMV